MIHPKISQSATMFGAQIQRVVQVWLRIFRRDVSVTSKRHRVGQQVTALKWTLAILTKGLGAAIGQNPLLFQERARNGKERKKHKGVTALLSASMKADCHVLVPCSSCVFFTSFVLVHFTLKCRYIYIYAYIIIFKYIHYIICTDENNIYKICNALI